MFKFVGEIWQRICVAISPACENNLSDGTEVARIGRIFLQPLK